MKDKKYDAGIPLDDVLVKEFVKAGHGDFEKTKELYEQEPNLLHAVANWGEGDWESALGAASHLGRREIAEWLLAKGARMDIFAAAMLGELDIVKGILRSQPEALHSAGPHGIPLMHHARMGGKDAENVYHYLQELIKEEAVQA